MVNQFYESKVVWITGVSSADKAARQILKAAAAGRHEVKVGLTPRTRLGHTLSRLWPAQLRRMLKKANMT